MSKKEVSLPMSPRGKELVNELTSTHGYQVVISALAKQAMTDAVADEGKSKAQSDQQSAKALKLNSRRLRKLAKRLTALAEKESVSKISLTILEDA